jgi:D-glycero-D-manno-heptose 1,7-bisphosphate phosphatase
MNHEQRLPVTQAVVLAGGRGTRLGPITEAIPKPLLPVGGCPFLDYQLWFLRKSGVTGIVMCVGYLSELVVARYRIAPPFGLNVTFSHETAPAGTGGALALARAHLDETFFVLNGDTILDLDLGALASALAADTESLGAVALREAPDTGRYGRVTMEGDRIAGFAEKSDGGPGLINGGVYCLRRSALDLLPPATSSLEKDLFPRLAAERRLLGKVCDGYFIDIGLPQTLERAETELPAWIRARNARFTDRYSVATTVG